MTERNLGKLHNSYGIAPVFLQRAAIVAILAFVFFLLMMLAFSVWKSIGYFLLATAFLVVEFFTLSGWIMQKRAAVLLYEKGFTYKKFAGLWDEIESVSVLKRKNLTVTGCEIRKKNGEKIVLPEMIHHIGEIAERIESKFKKEINNAADTTH